MDHELVIIFPKSKILVLISIKIGTGTYQFRSYGTGMD